MNISKKIVLGIIAFLAVVIISTNTFAIDIYQRALTNNMLLGVSVGSSASAGSSSTEKKTFTKTDWWNTWKNGGTVKVTWNLLKQTPELLCIESEAGLDKNKEIDYKMITNSIETFGKGESSIANENGKKEDYKIAYILSEQVKPEQTGELYEQDIQGALWRTKYNFDWSENIETRTETLAGEGLYKAAEAYAEYKCAYKEPKIENDGEVKTVNKNGDKVVGPFKITYAMQQGGPESDIVVFGDIKSATLKDENGKTYEYKTDWWFTNETGEELSSTVGGQTYNFPESDQAFYIKIRVGLNIAKANISFEFNNIDAQAESMKLKGSYEVGESKGGKLHLCDECQKILDEAMSKAECGDYCVGTKKSYHGYICTVTYNAEATCGSCKRYEMYKGDVPTSILTKFALRSRC